jgi:hypothetical protein
VALPSEAQGPMGANSSGQGGYQAPNNPAPVSGPGAMSQRTDGQPLQQLANAKYGEQKNFQQIQQGAPMAAGISPGAGPSPSAFAGAAGGAGSSVVPFGAPTQKPGEPVTSGANRGPGPGLDSLNLTPSTNKQDFVALRPALPMLQFLANLPGAHPGSQQFVRFLQSGGLPSNPQGQLPANVPNPALFAPQGAQTGAPQGGGQSGNGQ